MDNKTEKKFLGAIIVFMIVVLLLLCAVLVRGVRRAGGISRSTSFSAFLSARRTRGTLPVADSDLIRSWMTFDYINQLFGLPANYLKTGLKISDSRYPNLALSEYSESLSTSSAAFLNTVRQAVLDSTTTQQ
jgi:hypothetical protein